MADDFEREYEDDLDALLEMENEVGAEFDPFDNKSRKSLNFSTPSTRHVKKTTLTNNNDDAHNDSILNDSFPTPLPHDSPVVDTADNQMSTLKRHQEAMFGELSDDSEGEGTLTIDADLPDIIHRRKKPRLSSPMKTTGGIKSSSKSKVAAGGDHEDDFHITPPASPTPLEKAMNYKARHAQNRPRAENLEYQDRVTEAHDLERDRVLRLRPQNEDHVKVTSTDGIRVFMAVKDEVAQAKEVERISTNHKQLQLLGAPLSALKAQVEERKSRVLAQQLQALEDIANGTSEGLEPEPEEVVEKEGGKPLLWVERYSPQRYTELLSDEATNRMLLKWLKQWDYVVFGKECKLPKTGEQKKEGPQNKWQDNKEKWKDGKDKGGDGKGGEKGGKPFFKKMGPEVPDELDQHKRPINKVSLLCGPPGLGKTTLAHVIARHAGYNVVEINASDDRSADTFKTKIEAATQMKSVIGADPRPNCLIIDEIDGAPQSAINMLLSIIKGPDAATTKKKKKGGLLLRPIICICNDVYAPSLRQLRPLALTVTFPPTVSTKLASRLQQIARFEKLRADLTALLALCEKSDNDIRSCLNTLQFVRSKSRELTLAAVNSTSIGQKDAHKSLYSVWQSIFTMPKPKRKRYVNPHDRENLPLKQMEEMSKLINENNMSDSARFQHMLHLSQQTGETEKIMQGLYENYLLSKVKDLRLDLVQKANTWLCSVDIMQREVLATQNYSLWRYTQYLPVTFHLMFASNHHPKIQYPHSQFENLTKLNKAKGLMEAMLTDMAPSVRKNVNLDVAVMEMLPPLLDIIQPNLRPVNTQLYSQREKAELSQLIRIMIAYNMSYHQERTMDGQYVYNLDPCVDEVARLPGVKQHKQLTYAAKQLISREIELEKMRRSESGTHSEPVPVVTPAETVKATDGKVVVPNHRQKLQPKAIKVEDKYSVDFFGRKVQPDTTRPIFKADTRREVIGGDIWFRFKEGFTNAVRRTVRISDLS